MPEFSLPTEIWLIIATYLGRADFHSLIQVSRAFHNTFEKALYTDIVVRIDIKSLSPKPKSAGETESPTFAIAGPVAARLFERLRLQATIRTCVRSLCIKSLRKPYVPAQTREMPEYAQSESHYDAFVGSIANLLGELPMLQTLKFESLEIPTKWLIHLSSCPSQQLDLILRHTGVYSSLEASASHSNVTLQSFHLLGYTTVYDDSMFMNLLGGLSMRSMCFGSVSPNVLYTSFIRLGRPLLPHLRSLTIPYITREQLVILQAMPNLQELIFASASRLHNVEPSDIVSGQGPTGVMKDLESITVENRLISAFTAGRKITSISTVGSQFGLSDINLTILQNQFGSDVMVRTVVWKGCYNMGGLLDYLLAKNQAVWHLVIIPKHGPYSEVSHAWPDVQAVVDITPFHFLGGSRTISAQASTIPRAAHSRSCLFSTRSQPSYFGLGEGTLSGIMENGESVPRVDIP